MQNEKTEAPVKAEPPKKSAGTHPCFVGEMIPFKGFWFKVAELTDNGMILSVVSRSKKSGKR